MSDLDIYIYKSVETQAGCTGKAARTVMSVCAFVIITFLFRRKEFRDWDCKVCVYSVLGLDCYNKISKGSSRCVCILFFFFFFSFFLNSIICCSFLLFCFIFRPDITMMDDWALQVFLFLGFIPSFENYPYPHPPLDVVPRTQTWRHPLLRIPSSQPALLLSVPSRSCAPLTFLTDFKFHWAVRATGVWCTKFTWLWDFGLSRSTGLDGGQVTCSVASFISFHLLSILVLVVLKNKIK